MRNTSAGLRSHEMKRLQQESSMQKVGGGEPRLWEEAKMKERLNKVLGCRSSKT